MKKKILLLITGCIVTVLALAFIQGYFIYNTYQLHLREADHEVRQKLLDVEIDGKLDSLNQRWMKTTSNFITANLYSTTRDADFKSLILKIGDSLSAIEDGYINSEGLVADFDVRYNNYVKQVVLQKVGSNVVDTLFSGKMLLYGNTEKGATEILASQSKWTDNALTSSGDRYLFEVVTERSYCIDNWTKEIIAKMAGMLLFTVLLLAFVIILFYHSIKGLIMQKKIADIKSDFINNISHEFKTPIAVMDLAVKTLEQKENDLTAEQFENTLSIIGRQNKRMKKLFDQVSEASINASGFAIHPEKLDATDIEAVVDDFRSVHPQVEITFTADSKVTLTMDRQHLATLLHNLLDNAVKYGGTTIAVALSDSGGSTLLTVTDNGMGIPAKEKTAIFDKFYRIQKGDIHTTKGLGLGLYYVKQLVDAYNGAVTVTGDDNGSTFTITIPMP